MHLRAAPTCNEYYAATTRESDEDGDRKKNCVIELTYAYENRFASVLLFARRMKIWTFLLDTLANRAARLYLRAIHVQRNEHRANPFFVGFLHAHTHRDTDGPSECRPDGGDTQRFIRRR